MSERNKQDKTGAEEITWELSDLYNGFDDPKFDEDREWVRKQAREFADQYKGAIAELSPASFKEALQKYESILETLHKIGAFAYLKWTTNTEDAMYGKQIQEANELSSEINQQMVFFNVEWLQMDDAAARTIIDDEKLADYRHHLETSRQYKKHVLSEKEEQVMTAKSVTGRNAWVRFFDETMGAARYELDGEKLTQQEALSKLHRPDRDLRKRAQQALTDTFRDKSRTLTFVFNTVLADKHTNDRFRDYERWISSRNLSNEIDDDTVDTLVNAVTDRYELVQRYYRLKRDLLGYDTLYDYDRYAPLLESETTIQWKEAKDIVLESYKEFHPKMADVARQFFDRKWIDAAIKEGKRGGAYSASTVPSVHPYVFMNFDGRLRDVQTLAHELGHGVHQYLSRDQGLLEADTPLTTAETASVFGEMLVFQNLLGKLDDKREKLALVIGKIDDTIATVFRQISMNRFEDRIHNARREEGELSVDQFSEYWIETQQALYGDSVELTDNYRIWWSYIPHFLHTPGYVYAYAFGELLVLALYDSYTNSSNGFADRYIEMLKAGGSDWPENIVGKMGLDITQPDFWSNGLNAIERLIEQAEELAEDVD